MELTKEQIIDTHLRFSDEDNELEKVKDLKRVIAECMQLYANQVKEKGARSVFCTLVLNKHGQPIKCFRKKLKAEYYAGNDANLSLLRIEIQ